MSIYDTIEAPAQQHAIVDAVRDRLARTATILANYFISSGSDAVYRHWHPEDVPERFLVVRLVQEVGGRISNHAKIDDVPVQVMAALRRYDDEGREHQHVHRWHDAMHKRVYDAICGTTPSLRVGRVMLPIRIELYPSVPFFDDEYGFWYSTAQYNATLEGI